MLLIVYKSDNDQVTSVRQRIKHDLGYKVAQVYKINFRLEKKKKKRKFNHLTKKKKNLSDKLKFE